MFHAFISILFCSFIMFMVFDTHSRYIVRWKINETIIMIYKAHGLNLKSKKKGRKRSTFPDDFWLSKEGLPSFRKHFSQKKVYHTSFKKYYSQKKVHHCSFRKHTCIVRGAAQVSQLLPNLREPGNLTIIIITRNMTSKTFVLAQSGQLLNFSMRYYQ